ncbi:MAG: MFS transporter, partial [Candidatus Latescibacteria bacterium]|nr:MFS transporter [Candidatus Latescibacterota bacterium]
MKLKRLFFLSLGHIASDFYPGMLSPLLPLILDHHGLSMAHAGILVTVLQGTCNLSQPFVGVLNDTRPMKSFLWAGLIISGLPFCFLMQAGSLSKMIIALAISGIGVGMYHPVAAVAAGLSARGEHKSLSMAVFSSGGTIGFLTAPMFVVLVVKILGEQYMPLAIVPALLMAVYFIYDRDIVVSEKHHLTASEWFASLVENKRELTVLWLVSSFRAVVHLLVGSFLPLLIITRGSSYESSAFILSATLFAGM